MYCIFVDASWLRTIRNICTVFCFFRCLFVREQSVLLIAQDQNELKKKNKPGLYNKIQPNARIRVLHCVALFLHNKQCRRRSVNHFTTCAAISYNRSC